MQTDKHYRARNSPFDAMGWQVKCSHSVVAGVTRRRSGASSGPIASFQSGGYNGLPSTITAPATYTTVDLNQSSLLNTSNGYMEVPSGQAGFYEVFVNSNSGTANAHRGLYVYHKSGSTLTVIDNTFTMNDYSGYTISSHRMINLAAGDLIMWGYHNSYDQFNTSLISFNCWGRRIK